MNFFASNSNSTGYQKHYGVYKGIVIDNYDKQFPNSGRVQVYVPDVHGANVDELFGERDTFVYAFPGDGLIGDMNNKVVEYLRKFCPWCIPTMPVIGDAGPGIYGSKAGVGSVSDDPCNGLDDSRAPLYFTKPSNMYENTADGTRGDGHSDPSAFITGKGNPYGTEYASPSYSNAPKGSFSIPRVGAQLLISFFGGDANFPVYLGILPSSSDFGSIYEMDGTFPGSPRGFESLVDTTKLGTPVRDVNAVKPQPNINTDAQPVSKNFAIPSLTEVKSALDNIVNQLKKEFKL